MGQHYTILRMFATCALSCAFIAINAQRPYHLGCIDIYNVDSTLIIHRELLYDGLVIPVINTTECSFEHFSNTPMTPLPRDFLYRTGASALFDSLTYPYDTNLQNYRPYLLGTLNYPHNKYITTDLIGLLGVANEENFGENSKYIFGFNFVNNELRSIVVFAEYSHLPLYHGSSLSVSGIYATQFSAYFGFTRWTDADDIYYDEECTGAVRIGNDGRAHIFQQKRVADSHVSISEDEQCFTFHNIDQATGITLDSVFGQIQSPSLFIGSYDFEELMRYPHFEIPGHFGNRMISATGRLSPLDDIAGKESESESEYFLIGKVGQPFRFDVQSYLVTEIHHDTYRSFNTSVYAFNFVDGNLTSVLTVSERVTEPDHIMNLTVRSHEITQDGLLFELSHTTAGYDGSYERRCEGRVLMRDNGRIESVSKIQYLKEEIPMRD